MKVVRESAFKSGNDALDKIYSLLQRSLSRIEKYDGDRSDWNELAKDLDEAAKIMSPYLTEDYSVIKTRAVGHTEYPTKDRAQSVANTKNDKAQPGVNYIVRSANAANSNKYGLDLENYDPDAKYNVDVVPDLEVVGDDELASQFSAMNGSDITGEDPYNAVTQAPMTAPKKSSIDEDDEFVDRGKKLAGSSSVVIDFNDLIPTGYDPEK